jgi:hypothetical protein
MKAVMKTKLREIAMPASAAKPTHRFDIVERPIREKPTQKMVTTLAVELVGEPITEAMFRKDMKAHLEGMVMGGMGRSGYALATVQRVTVRSVASKD